MKLVTQSEAKAAIEAGGVAVYRRPGCPFCARLEASLSEEQREKVAWVDIWQDEDAAAYVRSVNDGNETVPTVVIDGRPLTNPSPKLVAEALNR